MKHIRTTDASVKDRRFRQRVMYSNKLRPVFCAAQPTPDDVSRCDALHFLKHAAIKPEWSADLCPACISLLTS